MESFTKKQKEFEDTWNSYVEALNTLEIRGWKRDKKTVTRFARKLEKLDPEFAVNVGIVSEGGAVNFS